MTVDEALAIADNADYAVAAPNEIKAMHVLAGEVRRLRVQRSAVLAFVERAERDEAGVVQAVKLRRAIEAETEGARA
jgi:hypothetical protein